MLIVINFCNVRINITSQLIIHMFIQNNIIPIRIPLFTSEFVTIILSAKEIIQFVLFVKTFICFYRHLLYAKEIIQFVLFVKTFICIYLQLLSATEIISFVLFVKIFICFYLQLLSAKEMIQFVLFVKTSRSFL